MLAPITTLATSGGPGPSPAEGLAPPFGPLVTLSFTLPIAGPVPNIIQPPAPQSCQNSSPNVVLQAEIVDQDGEAVDLSEATGLQFWLLAPDGSSRPIPAAFTSNGMDGLIQYITTSQDLTEAGTWGIQAQLQFNTSFILTRWYYFAVLPNVVDF